MSMVGFLAAPADALEIRQGRIRLTLHEESGRFSVAYLANIQQDRYVPYLFRNDPRTSFLSIFADNSVYRMGESARFEQRVERTSEGGRITWSSSSLEIDQTFRIIRSANADLANGLEITLRIRNVSERTITVGAAYILDTYLGEEEGPHFRTNTEAAVSSESRFTPAGGTNFLVSPAEEDSDLGLMVMLTGEEVTEAQVAITANWKRLSERPWSYQVNPQRDFNLLPYSINDSALGLYYSREELGPGAERTIATRMGNATAGGFSRISGSDTSTQQLLDQSGEGSGTQEGPYGDLVQVNDILAELNTLLENPSEASAERIDVLRKALESVTEEYETE
jgi:hypothetical protein